MHHFLFLGVRFLCLTLPAPLDSIISALFIHSETLRRCVVSVCGHLWLQAISCKDFLKSVAMPVYELRGSQPSHLGTMHQELKAGDRVIYVSSCVIAEFLQSMLHLFCQIACSGHCA